MEKNFKGCVIKAVKGDITRETGLDVLVLGADKTLYLDSGVCKAIHKLAGSELYKAVKELGGCELGQARITPAFEAPCKSIIHAAVPRWNGGMEGEEELLYSSYSNICKLAADNSMKSLAMPSLGTGVYGWPLDLAVRTGIRAVMDFLEERQGELELVEWVLFEEEIFKVYKEQLNDFFPEA